MPNNKATPVPVLVRNIQSSTFIGGQWGPYVQIMSDVYAASLFIIFPLLIGFGTGNLRAAGFTALFVGSLTPFATSQLFIIVFKGIYRTITK